MGLGWTVGDGLGVGDGVDGGGWGLGWTVGDGLGMGWTVGDGVGVEGGGCIHVNLYGMPVSLTDFHPFRLLTGVHLKSYGL